MWAESLIRLRNLAAVIFMSAIPAFSQQPLPSPPQPLLQPSQKAVKLSSAEVVAQDGLTVERLIELGSGRRADLLAARQQLAIAEGRLRQARLRPNPTLEAEYGSPRFLGGEAESDLSVGITQVFELGGKRRRRAAVAELEISRVKAQIAAIERELATGIRLAYTGAIAAARRLDVLERLIANNEELIRATESRLSEGDAAPLDLNLVKVENDRMRVQAIQARSDLDTQLLLIRTLIGADIAEPLKIAPQPDRPPRFDATPGELIEIALTNRADLQAARIGEELGTARLDLARANATPNVAASVRYSRSKGVFDLPGPVNGIDFVDDADNELTFGVSVDIPIFNRNQGEIASATAERLQAARQREFLENAIKRDVAVAYRKYRAAAESLVVYATQIMPRSEQNLQTVQAAYGFGEFSIFEVISEQRRLAENTSDHNQSLKDYYNALTELETAIGRELPPSGFAPGSTSVLPDKQLDLTPEERAMFLKTLTNGGQRKISKMPSELSKEPHSPQSNQKKKDEQEKRK